MRVDNDRQAARARAAWPKTAGRRLSQKRCARAKKAFEGARACRNTNNDTDKNNKANTSKIVGSVR